MPCPKCTAKPGYHSYKKIASLKGLNLFYTSPAKTEDFDEDGTKLTNVKTHIKEDTAGKPWIWIMDCANMELKHYAEVNFTTGLLTALANDTNLKEVWVVRPNIWIRSTVAFFKTVSSAQILNNISYYEGETNMDLYEALKATGLDEKAIHWIIAQ